MFKGSKEQDSLDVIPSSYVDIGPHGEEIIHDPGFDFKNKEALLASEKVDLAKLHDDFLKFTQGGTYSSLRDSADNVARPTVMSDKLDLYGDYIEQLRQEASLLNQEFLANSEYQFAEYLGLTMI